MVYLDQISYVFIETLFSHWYAKMWRGCICVYLKNCPAIGMHNYDEAARKI